MYLYDGLGQSDLILLDVQSLHPSLLLLVQDLTQLRGHFSLHREEPGIRSNAHLCPQTQLITLETHCTFTFLISHFIFGSNN